MPGAADHALPLLLRPPVRGAAGGALLRLHPELHGACLSLAPAPGLLASPAAHAVWTRAQRCVPLLLAAASSVAKDAHRGRCDGLGLQGEPCDLACTHRGSLAHAMVHAETLGPCCACLQHLEDPQQRACPLQPCDMAAPPIASSYNSGMATLNFGTLECLRP